MSINSSLDSRDFVQLLSFLRDRINKEDTAAVEYFLTSHPEILEQNEGVAAFHTACHHSLIIVKLLLTLNPKLNDPQFRKGFHGHSMTPIMSACRGQNLGVLKFFLDMKPTLSSVEIQHITAFFDTAFAKQQTEIVDFFLTHHSDKFPDVKKKMRSEFSKAFSSNCVEMVKVIVKFDPELAKEVGYTGRTIFLESCYKGKLEMVKFFLENRPESIEERDEDGNLGIHLASRKGHENIIKFFIDDLEIFNNNPDYFYVKNNQGLTPFDVAIIHKTEAVQKQLLAAYEQKKSRDIKGENNEE